MKKTYTILITVWSAMAVVLAGLLIFLIVSENNRIGFNLNFNEPNNIKARTASQSFKASDISEINISSKNADINFSKTQEDNIKVNIQTNSDSTINVSKSGSALNIEQKGLEKFKLINLEKNVIDITLPDSYKKDISISSGSGDISIKGNFTFSKVKINEASGDIIAGSIAADTFSIKEASGDTDISSINSVYDINSASGDINVDSLSGSGCIKTASGDLKLGVAELDGPLDTDTISGDTNIKFSQGVNAEISSATVSGSIKSDFNMSYSGKEASGTIGCAPYNKVDMSTVSGDATLSKS